MSVWWDFPADNKLLNAHSVVALSVGEVQSTLRVHGAVFSFAYT